MHRCRRDVCNSKYFVALGSPIPVQMGGMAPQAKVAPLIDVLFRFAGISSGLTKTWSSDTTEFSA